MANVAAGSTERYDCIVDFDTGGALDAHTDVEVDWHRHRTDDDELIEATRRYSTEAATASYEEDAQECWGYSDDGH